MELDPGKSTIRCMYVYVCVCMYVPHKVWVGYRRVGNPMNIVIQTLAGFSLSGQTWKCKVNYMCVTGLALPVDI